MIGITRLDARGNNKNGESVTEYLMATEYYFDKDGNKQEAMRWGGKLADVLSLAGKRVEHDDMKKLAQGYPPDGAHLTNSNTGERLTELCKNAGEVATREVVKDHEGNPRVDEHGKPVYTWRGGHRVGVDLTFEPPKDLSALYALEDSERRDAILNAHRKAVQVALDYLESKVETRREKGGKDVIECNGLIYSQHDHFANRNLDAHLHTHVLVYNVSQGVDGEWGTFDNNELYRHRFATDAIFQNELASNLRELGYGIEQRLIVNEKKGTETMSWGVAGMSEDLLNRFSSRRQEILEYMETHQVADMEAWRQTRRHKDEPSFQEMDAIWQKIIQDVGVDKEAIRNGQDKRLEDVDRATRLQKLHENTDVLCENDLVKEVGFNGMGFMRKEDIFQEVQAWKQELVEAPKLEIHEDDRGATLARKHTETRWCSPEVMEKQREIVRMTKEREKETALSLDPERVAKVLEDYEKKKNFTLTDEQRNNIMHITCKTKGVACMEGFAGTGKTTVSDVYSEAFKEAGFSMIGVAVSNKAAQKLQSESGMPSQSVAKTLQLLEKGQLTLNDKTVMVVDEAGMIDSMQTHALMTHCQKAGSKLILQGDTNQLQPIGVGSGFQLAIDAIGSEKLTEIRRQKSDKDKDVAKTFYDTEGEEGLKSRAMVKEKGKRIMSGLLSGKSIEEFYQHDEAMNGLIKDYFNTYGEKEDKLVLGHTRDDVASLNRLLREGYKERGEIDDDRKDVVKCKRKVGFESLEFAKGDCIRFCAREDALGVVNGTEGRIVHVKPDKGWGTELTVDIKTPEGKEQRIAFNCHEYNALDYNYATTVHQAQGQGAKHVFHRANVGMMDNQASLVAFTRLTSGKYRMYATSDEMERMDERFGLDRKKENVLTKDQIQSIKQEHAPEQEPHMTLGEKALSKIQSRGLGLMRR